MEMLLQGIFSPEFLYSIIRVTTPILFAALGVMISQRAGVTNIALEGIMLSSALAGVVGSAYTNSIFVGFICALMVGLLMSALLAYFALKLKSEIFLTGLMINLFASGGTVFLMYMLCNDKGMTSALNSAVFPQIQIPIIKDIPILGDILSNHNILTYVAFISVLVLSIILNKTRMGLRIRSVGENPNAAESVGINVTKIQVTAILISGVLGALGGMYMSMGYVSWFSRDMVAGRGFIGVAAQSLGRTAPGGTLIASIVFGAADALGNMLQSLRIPTEFIQMIPYVTTIAGLIFYSMSRKKKILKQKRLKNTRKKVNN